MRAATRLFAERGVETVSLREITRAAGQRNSSALQYHFTDRQTLLRDILSEHALDTGTRRHALLDHQELRGLTSLRELASALVLPLVAKLEAPEEGRSYLQICAELLGRTNRTIGPADPVSLVVKDPAGSLARWGRLVAASIPAEALGPPLHRRFAAIHFAHQELGRRARDDSHDHTLFSSCLIDLVAAVLAAPVTEETRRIMDERRSP